jgi:hypothetical protein
MSSHTVWVWVAVLVIIGIVLFSIDYAGRTDRGGIESAYSSGKGALSPGEPP